MPQFDQTDLQKTFQRATDLFKQGDYDGLLPLLHPDIMWKMLHHADSVTGSDNVIGWLKAKKATLLPQFIPETIDIPPANPGDGSRIIRGSALWQAQRGGPNEKIEYIFTFTTDRDGRWLLANAFAHLTN